MNTLMTAGTIWQLCKLNTANNLAAQINHLDVKREPPRQVTLNAARSNHHTCSSYLAHIITAENRMNFLSDIATQVWKNERTMNSKNQDMHHVSEKERAPQGMTSQMRQRSLNQDLIMKRVSAS